MSVRWITCVWETSPYEGRRLLLHLALADYANDEGTCFPSQKTLANKARTTEAWTSTTIRQMVRDGLLAILEQGGGRGNRTIYQLKKPSTHFGESQIGETQSRETPNVDASHTTYRNRNEPSQALVDGFDAFWKIYPRKVAKTAARNVFMTIMRKADAPSLEMILDGVKRYASMRLEMRYIAHPATWLRQGRWEDDVEAPEVPVVRDEVLHRALDRVVPMARLGRSWSECLDELAGYEEHVVAACRDAYDAIRAGA